MRLPAFLRKFSKRMLAPRVRAHLEPDLVEFFYRWILRQNTFAKGWSPANNYYEFGVAGGGSMAQFAEAAQLFCNRHGASLSQFNLFGFDSFSGLPPIGDDADDHATWGAGKMAHGQDEVNGRLRALGFDMSRVRLIPGYYETSLTPQLQTELLRAFPPAIVNLDCDYYSSTRTVLDWLEPHLPSGAVLYFDDIWSFHGSPHHGQVRALAETNQRGVVHLTECGMYGMPGHTYLCARREWEYPSSDK